ncbi:MAG: hypothetical protein ACOYL3_10600 [Desulfuromonadaceae bacterium]
MRIAGLLIAGFLLVAPVGSVAEENSHLNFNNAPKIIQEAQASVDVAPTADKLTHEFRVLQENNKYKECLVLTIGVIISLIVVLFFVSRSRNYSTTHIIHASGLVLIVFGTIYVIILSDSDAHITGTMGVLGATAGYLFGSMGKNTQSNPVAADVK